MSTAKFVKCSDDEKCAHRHSGKPHGYIVTDEEKGGDSPPFYSVGAGMAYLKNGVRSGFIAKSAVEALKAKIRTAGLPRRKTTADLEEIVTALTT